MKLTTKIAKRLKEMKENLSDTSGLDLADEHKMYGEKEIESVDGETKCQH